MLNLNYVTDTAGNQIGVQIPMADWLSFQQEFEAIKRKLEILQGLKDALGEVKNAQKENRKLQPLKDFLNEC
jgi:gamma-glutamyl phosphate reductase